MCNEKENNDKKNEIDWLSVLFLFSFIKRPKGHWIQREYELKCSVCGRIQEGDIFKWALCPFCGADMTDVQNEKTEVIE